MSIKIADDKKSILVGTKAFSLTPEQAAKARTHRNITKSTMAVTTSKLTGIEDVLGPEGRGPATALRAILSRDTDWTRENLDDVDAKLAGAVSVCGFATVAERVRQILGDKMLSAEGQRMTALQALTPAMTRLESWLYRLAGELVEELREAEGLITAALMPEKVPGQDAAVAELRGQEIRSHFFGMNESQQAEALTRYGERVALEQLAAVTSDPAGRLAIDKRALDVTRCEVIQRQGGDFVLVNLEDARDRLDAAKWRMTALHKVFEGWASDHRLPLEPSTRPWESLIEKELDRSQAFLAIFPVNHVTAVIEE
ncbi:MAG TPA: hypothetical protein DGF30_02785 [Desulfomicrobium sp.]|nr:hypothetical protein [Desulfomicrobium sp.]